MPNEGASDYEDAGDYGPQVEISIEYRDEAQRQRFHSLLWQGDTKINPELAGLLCTAAKDAYRKVFAAHFGEALMSKWRMDFRARASGWIGDESEPDTINVEVESASQVDDAGFRRVHNLTHQESTEATLLKSLREAFTTYLNLHASKEIAQADERLSIQIEITEYGGG